MKGKMYEVVGSGFEKDTGGKEMKIPNEKRPTCSCGELMELVEYDGHYDYFRFFACGNRNCGLEIDDYDPDDKMQGPNAF